MAAKHPSPKLWRPRGDGRSCGGERGRKVSLPTSGAPCCDQMSVGRPVALRDVKIALQKPNEELLIVRGAPGTGSHYFSET